MTQFTRQSMSVGKFEWSLKWEKRWESVAICILMNFNFLHWRYWRRYRRCKCVYRVWVYFRRSSDKCVPWEGFGGEYGLENFQVQGSLCRIQVKLTSQTSLQYSSTIWWQVQGLGKLRKEHFIPADKVSSDDMFSERPLKCLLIKILKTNLIAKQ